jgi:hypothetical protein
MEQKAVALQIGKRNGVRGYAQLARTVTVQKHGKEVSMDQKLCVTMRVDVEALGNNGRLKCGMHVISLRSYEKVAAILSCSWITLALS